MKKNIILGICVTSIILLVAPTIPAIQYKQAEESIQISIQDQIDFMLNKLQSIDSGKIDIKYYENSISNALNLIIENIESFEYYALTSFIGFILSTIISLIFAVIGTIFGIIFGPILSVLIQLLTLPAVLLAKLISLLLGDGSLIGV